MRPPGLREVERAQADGRWDGGIRPALATAEVPEDLERALRRNRPARAVFATLSPSRRYRVLYNIQEAKRSETRARRIEKFVEMLARGEKP